MRRYLIFISWVVFPIGMYAADLPDVIIDTNNSDQKMCVQRIANDCISTVCPTSSDRNCQENCVNDAQNRCTAMQQ